MTAPTEAVTLQVSAGGRDRAGAAKIREDAPLAMRSIDGAFSAEPVGDLRPEPVDFLLQH